MSEKKVTIYEGSGEWSAVYLGDTLQEVGDHYLADDWVRQHFGVETIPSDDFMRGGDDRESVAPTLTDLHAYAEDLRARKARADELRAQAASLIEQAKQVEEGRVVRDGETDE